LRAFVDSQCKTAETQEANNRIAYPYAAVLPDLVVDRITINLSTPRAFQNFTVTVLVKNIGNGTWRSSGSPVWVHWHLIGPGINEYTRINMANYTNTLMPGAGYVWITTWKLPAGSYRFEATVDDSNAVPESNELNNTLSRTFVVTR
jgi:subtilase family serine protease